MTQLERKVIATICARGGSKGVPGKNAKNLLGKPLIVWAIEQAIRCKSVNAGVYVSTDDAYLADLAREAGATVPYLRPANLATDEAGKLPVIVHLCEFLREQGIQYDAVVDIDPTCPLRADSDIDGAVAALSDSADVVIGVCESRKNPYFNMVEYNDDGFAQLVKPRQ